MTDKKRTIDSNAIAQDIGEKVKKAVTEGNILQDIPNIIMDTLSSHGIELPEKAKQAIQEYLSKLKK